MTDITTIAALEALYDGPLTPATVVKDSPVVTAHYRALIEASPFVALATAGPEGLDCSPRGDRGAVVTVLDPKTLALPDRRGNNRIESLRNIVRDPRVALLFLIPGSGTTFRVNGRARISVAPDLLARFAVDGTEPRSVILISIETCYFQCARAVVRSDLWNPERHVKPGALPSPGDILAAMTNGEVGGRPYDDAWPARAAASLW
jgi:PPOX class probable FMN-dependent enzyme